MEVKIALVAVIFASLFSSFQYFILYERWQFMMALTQAQNGQHYLGHVILTLELGSVCSM